ncbi:MAG: hypothetical protein A2017_12190 [Lentisphaerae bacterium GWF2_44_16]|nr:MAG: hypothetical protein A2017_12190 [Lentisphaerae bacterium GWF2_44_16]
MRIYPENCVILAPLSGFTDLPYRVSARSFGCRFAFTEMIDAGSLARGTSKTLRFLERGKDEDWLGVQIIGAEDDSLAKAVDIINQHDFSVLDFNLGCPAPKVVKKGEGAALGRKPDEAVKKIEILVRMSKIPVTAKIRILDENDPAPTLYLAKRLRDAGAAALTVHGRVLKAFYSGPVYYDIIAELRRELDIQVIANGGVMNYENWLEIREKTGCGSVMLARGAMGNPWIFSEINNHSAYSPPTVAELAGEMERHVGHIIEYYGETLAMRISRKIILDYLRGRGFSGKLKALVSKLVRKSDFEAFMNEVKKGPSYKYWKCLESEKRLHTERFLSR